MDDQTASSPPNLLGLTADLVAAYVTNNSIPVTELPGLFAKVHASLIGLTSAVSSEPSKPEPATPSEIRKSITPDALISFEDGKPYKTLRRHLTLRGLSSETYREKWGLPADYPMTSASYSAQRAELARSSGLGQQRRSVASAVGDDQAPDEGAPAKRRGRPPGSAKATQVPADD